MNEKRPLRCHNCGYKLAEFDDKNVLRIKYKDLRIESRVASGTVTITCPRCRWSRTWDSAVDGPVAIDHTSLLDYLEQPEAEPAVRQPEIDPLVCSICGMKAKSPAGLASHMRHKHNLT